MIDLSIYDYLEKIVKEQEENLNEFQKLCGCKEQELKLGINSLQSIIRNSVIEEQQEDPAYSRIVYRKNKYESIKLGNIKFDMDSVISLISNVPGVIAKEKWAILMTVLAIIAELKKIKVELSPVMGIIVSVLYKNGYKKNSGKMIGEEELKGKVEEEALENFNESEIEDKFSIAINGLANLKVIEIVDGKIRLVEDMNM